MFKKLKPVTPSLRHSFILIKNLRKAPLLKSFVQFYKQKLGKNLSGNIITKHRQRGVKKKYRVIDRKRKTKSKGIVCSVEHDPYRSAFIMSVFETKKKKFFYALASENISIGDSVESGKVVPVKSGNSTLVGRVPAGATVFNVSINSYGEGKFSRAAGTYCLVLGHKLDYTYLEMMSGEVRLVPWNSRACLGKASNEAHFLEQSGKAGRSRWLGKRPKVRGVAMNPIDHPNGGGEGKKSGYGKTPWGKPGKKGRLKNISNLIVKKRYD